MPLPHRCPTCFIATSTIIAIMFVDLKQKPMAPGEIRRFIERFTLAGLLDTESKVFVDAEDWPLPTMPSGLEIWCSDPVSWRSEFRVFVAHGRVLGVRCYDGDPGVAPDGKTIQACVTALGRKIDAISPRRRARTKRPTAWAKYSGVEVEVA